MNYICNQVLRLGLIICLLVLFNSQSIAQLENDNMRLVVPAFNFPDSLNDPFWTELNWAAGILGERLIVIVNPGNGPGVGCPLGRVPTGPHTCDCIPTDSIATRPDGSEYNFFNYCRDDFNAYFSAISTLQGLNATVIGYSPMGFGNVGFIPLTHNRVRWYFWHDIDGLFYNEASALPENNYTYWQQWAGTYHIVNGAVDGTKSPHVAETGDPLVIFNPGVVPTNDNDWTYHDRTDWLIVVQEDFANNYPSPDLARLSEEQQERSVIILHTLAANANWQRRIDDIGNNGYDYFYLTDDIYNENDDTIEPYDELPSFFRAMVQYIE